MADLLGEAELLARLGEAVRAAGGEVELSYAGSRTGPTRFANGDITQPSVVADRTVQARVALGRRAGSARGSRLDPAGLAELVARARAIAAASPELEGFPGLPEAEPCRRLEAAWDEATASAGPAERARLVEPVLAAARERGGLAAGALTTVAAELAVASSRGVAAYHRGTSAKLEVIAADGRASGYAHAAARALGGIDAAAEGRRAAEALGRMRSRVSVAPGPIDVILEPPAVAELLEWLGIGSFGARSVENGTSLLAGRAGDAVTGAAITIRDAGAEDLPEGQPVPFDSEGVPRRAVVLVARGRAGGPVHDSTTAARAGSRSTGHAPPFDNDGEGPVPSGLVLEPGDDDAADLVARVERGLWLQRLHYVNGLLDPRRALMTGLTRDGAFLIEHGRLGPGVETMRFTDSILEAFARCAGLTRARRAVMPWWATLGAHVVPTMLIRGLRFG